MSLKRKRDDMPVSKFIGPKAVRQRTSYRRKRQNKLRSMLSRPQGKYHDVTQSATEINYDSIQNILLNGISVGDTDTTRDGQSILMNSLQIKGVFENLDNSQVTAEIRYLIVLDRYPNQASSNLTEVLQLSTAAADVHALRNRTASAQDRFKVLVDKMFLIGDKSNAHFLPYKKMFEHYIKLADIAQFNDDGTGQTTDFQKGSLYFMAISSTAVAGTGPTVAFHSRVSYYDK